VVAILLRCGRAVASMMLGILWAGTASGQVPSVQEVESRALQARQQIRTLQATFEVEPTSFGSRQAPARLTTTIWLSGNQIRADVVRQGSAFAGFRTVECLNCDKEGWGIRANDMPRMATSVFRLGPSGAEDMRDAIDPRLIGYAPNTFAVLKNMRLDSWVGRTDRDDPAVTAERFEGLNCWVVRWANKNGWRSGVWVCPSQGHNVIRIESRSPPNEKQQLVQAVTSELVQVQPSGLWFPRRAVYEQRTDDDLEYREIIQVSDVRVNEPIPAETFTLAGIGLRPGAFVLSEDRKKGGRWDPVTKTTTRPVPPANLFQDTTPATPVDPDTPRPTNYWLVAACVGFALAAVAVVLVRRRAAPG
jgi:hypothetical protein